MTKDTKGLADSAPAVVTDHPFEPERERLGVKAPWWGLCGKCGLAQAAHATYVRIELRLKGAS